MNIGILEYYQSLYDKDTIKATNFRRARRMNWKKSILTFQRKGLIEEAARYQKYANIRLTAFHDYITKNNTKIQRFKPISDVNST